MGMGHMDQRDPVIREQLIATLCSREAHMSFDEAIAGFPLQHINTRPPNTPYTFWHLLEHVRICQWDLLDYSRNPNYAALPFPEGYWPASTTIASPEQWHETIWQFHADLDTIETLIRDERFDLFTPPAHAWQPDHTPYRDFLVLADHNAYHTGEIAILRQVMGLWPSDRADGWHMAAPPNERKV